MTASCSAIGASCLNTAGLEYVQARPAALTNIIDGAINMPDSNTDKTHEVGAALDELARHHPSLRPTLFKTALDRLSKAVAAGRDFVPSEEEKKEYLYDDVQNPKAAENEPLTKLTSVVKVRQIIAMRCRAESSYSKDCCTTRRCVMISSKRVSHSSARFRHCHVCPSPSPRPRATLHFLVYTESSASTTTCASFSTWSAVSRQISKRPSHFGTPSRQIGPTSKRSRSFPGCHIDSRSSAICCLRFRIATNESQPACSKRSGLQPAHHSCRTSALSTEPPFEHMQPTPRSPTCPMPARSMRLDCRISPRRSILRRSFCRPEYMRCAPSCTGLSSEAFSTSGAQTPRSRRSHRRLGSRSRRTSSSTLNR